MSEIKTYPRMNEAIKDILGQSENDADQYAVARIVELEKALEEIENTEDELAGSDVCTPIQEIVHFALRGDSE